MQYFVKIGHGEERKARVKWLEENGYEGKLPNEYPYGVIVVEGNHFSASNVTCIAANIATGNACITWEEWLKRLTL